MIGIKIQGRLGNQLFQYSYARVLSNRYKTPFFFLNYKKFYLDKYFNLRPKSFCTNVLNMVKFYIKNMGRLNLIIEDQFADPCINIAKEADNAIYDGYYQSFKYHDSFVANLIKEELTIKTTFAIQIRDYVKNDGPTLVVHVRRTDYITFGGDHVGGINLTLPISYYNEALKLIPTHQCNVLFLSDDIDFVKKNFNFPNAQYAENNPEIVDFQLLMQADYLILANSSFSWWGAYLNEKAQKIIAPKYWLGLKINKEYPEGIIHPNWITV